MGTSVNLDDYWGIDNGSIYDTYNVVRCSGILRVRIPSLCGFMGQMDSITVKFYRDAGVGASGPGRDHSAAGALLNTLPGAA